MSAARRERESSAWRTTAPALAVRHWSELGVEDAVDLAGLYARPEELQDDLQSLALSADEVVQATTGLGHSNGVCKGLRGCHRKLSENVLASIGCIPSEARMV